ncbi:MAG: four helix bundle protein [Verrucomicrobia bacterium]|nr:MAG: four helix bundle protein [Verrucomicrobiota bacterium]
MKKKASDLECPIIHWNADSRVKEDAAEYGAARRADSTEFSARIIRLVDALPNTRAGNHVAGQLLRSGTSPYGNHGEVEAAESLKDFIHKLKVCLKELKETRRWLRLIEKSKMLSEKSMIPILAETEQLIRIFFTSILTAEQNAK